MLLCTKYGTLVILKLQSMYNQQIWSILLVRVQINLLKVPQKIHGSTHHKSTSHEMLLDKNFDRVSKLDTLQCTWYTIAVKKFAAGHIEHNI